MPEEFGTVSMKTGERSPRDVELLRQHYRSHRDTLARLAAEAPTEHLATEYHRLIKDIDAAQKKLDELEGRATPPPPSYVDTNPVMKTSPGTRPLVRSAEPTVSERTSLPPVAGAQTRIMFIIAAGVVVLTIIGWLIWRASSERTPQAIVEQPVTSTNAVTTVPPAAVTPAPVAAAVLKVTPASADYGIIHKGTRAVRQFEIVNLSDNLVEIQVARSACRCLFYDYNEKVPARGKETITVTVDGARAKAGPLQEEIEVSAKKDPSVGATFGVKANIR